MHMRRLEEQLGCALFVKQGRGREADERGRAAHRLCPPHHAGRGGRHGRAVAQGPQGRRAASASPTITPRRYLADILTRFNHHHPLVEIAVTCENSIELAALVHGGALELALVTDPRGVAGLRADPRGALALGGLDPLQQRPRASRFRSRWAVPPASGAGVADEALEGRRDTVRGLFVSQQLHRHRHRGARGPRRDRSAARA